MFFNNDFSKHIKINTIHTEPPNQFSGYNCICRKASSTTQLGMVVVSHCSMVSLSIRKCKIHIFSIKIKKTI